MSPRLALGLTSCALPAMATAAEAAPHAGGSLSPRQIFLLLFLMLGPVKILLPFVTLTRGVEPPLRRRLATRAILFSAAALAIAGLLGRTMLRNLSIPAEVLALTGGLVLFLVALTTVLQQFSGPMRPPAAGGGPALTEEELRAAAINPLAFPVIVTPYGIAATILFVEFAAGDPGGLAMLAAIVSAILLIDWVAMVFAHAILRWAGTALQVFAVVLGVTQIGLGLKVMLQSLSVILAGMPRP